MKGDRNWESQKPIFEVDPKTHASDLDTSQWMRKNSVAPNVGTEMVKNAFKGCLRFSDCLAEPSNEATASEAIEIHSGFSEYFQRPSDSVGKGLERFSEALADVASHLESAYESTVLKLPGQEELEVY